MRKLKNGGGGGDSLVKRVMNFVNTAHQRPANLVVKHFDAKRKAVAMKNPTYATIESRRGEDGLILLSEDLTLADWATQVEISGRVKKPRHVKFAEALCDSEVFGVVGKVAKKYHRARTLLTGGIAEEEWWGLNSSLCLRLAKQLEALAEGMHSWPGEERGYKDPEEWVSVLRTEARNLRRYLGSVEQDAALAAWHKLVTTQGVDAGLLEAAKVEHKQIESSDRAAAKSALVWVAQNLDWLDD